MLSSDRRKVIFALSALPLAACGFTPTYGDKGPVAGGLKGQFAFAQVQSRADFELDQRLKERLGQGGGGSPYLLAFVLSVKSRENSITDNAEVDRFNLIGEAAFTVRSRETGEMLFKDRVRTFTAYSTTGATYPSRVSRQDAESRLSRSLADLIVVRLTNSAPDWKV